MKKDYIIYGLSEEQLKTICKQALDGELKNDVRIIFNMFGRVSHLEVSLTDKEAKQVRKQMKKDNRHEKDSHYELFEKLAA